MPKVKPPRVSDVAVRAPSLAEQTRAFFTPLRLTQNDELGEPYRQVGWIYAAMRAIAGNIAQTPFRLLAGEESNPTPLESGPWVTLFDRPNPLVTNRTEFWEATVLWLLHGGEAVWVKESGTDARVGPREVPAELWPADGRRFEPLLDAETKLPRLWKFVDGDGRAVLYAPHELVFFRLTNPYNPLRGLGPLQAANLAVRGDVKAQLFNEKFFDNDATPGGVLVSAKPLNREQRKELRQGWEDRHQGTLRRRRLAILEGGLDYKETGVAHREMEFVKLREMSRQEILAIFKVPEIEVGLTENLNFASADASRRLFWENVLVPYMKLLEDSAWSQLFKPVVGGPGERLARAIGRRLGSARFGRRLAERPDDGQARGEVWGEFDLAAVPVLQENFAARVETATKLRDLGYPLNTINERLSLDLEEPPHGELALVPGSLVPVEEVLSEGDGAESTPAASVPPSAPDEEPAVAESPVGSSAKTAERTTGRDGFEDRATRPQREGAWRLQLRTLVPLENKFRRKFTRWLFELRAAQLKLLAKYAPPERAAGDQLRKEDIERVLFQTAEWGNKLKTLSHPLYLEATGVGATNAAAELGGTFAFDVVDPRVVDFVSRREETLVKAAQTVRQRLARTVERGVEAGETIGQLQDRVKAEFNAFSGPRSLVVARTEMAGAVNGARNLVFEAEGVTRHTWTTARDENVRESHAEQDGVTVELGQPFPNGLLYPGDPSGDAGEVVNCRCVAVAED